MKKGKWVCIWLLMNILLLLLGCSQPKVETPTLKSELPTMSSREVILLVIEYNERIQRQYGIAPTQPRKVSDDWDAQYLGDGVWRVTLPVPGEGSYEFIVHENNKSVQDLGLRH